jgi:hypothetical protein
MTFLMRALMIGYGLGTQQSFTFLLVQQMGGTELLMGVMLLVSAGWRFCRFETAAAAALALARASRGCCHDMSSFVSQMYLEGMRPWRCW